MIFFENMILFQRKFFKGIYVLIKLVFDKVTFNLICKRQFSVNQEDYWHDR